VRGHAPLARVALISESVTTLQEQTIIEVPSMKPRDEPENGYLTRCLIIRKTGMAYYNRSNATAASPGLELFEQQFDRKQEFGRYPPPWLLRCSHDIVPVRIIYGVPMRTRHVPSGRR
jgi:hypothetical protein